MKTTEPHIYGLLAEFNSPDKLLHAARVAHHDGYRKMDAYTPFPIHGLSAALGFHQTKLPLIVLAGGIIGALAGFGMQYFATVIHYPVNIGGRPLNSWPSYIIITFELTILFAGLSAVLGMLALNGLPQPYHPVFNARNFELASRTHFFLAIETVDPKFNLEGTAHFLEGLGATAVTVISSVQLAPPEANLAHKTAPYHPTPGTTGAKSVSPANAPRDEKLGHVPSLLIGLLMLGAAFGAGGCDDSLNGMEERGRITAQEPSEFFADGQSDRPLVQGTVARGQLRVDEHLYTGKVNGKDADTFPFPVTRTVIERGQRQYTIFCSMCHNDTGEGNGMVVQRGFTPPPSYHDERLRNAPVGHFFDVITNGFGAMYSFNDRISVEDRWAIAAYIRVLQVSQNAQLASLPPEDQQKFQQAATQPARAVKLTPHGGEEMGMPGH